VQEQISIYRFQCHFALSAVLRTQERQRLIVVERANPLYTGCQKREDQILKKSLFALMILSAITILLLNCGRDQELESIQVQPVSETFGSSTIPLIDDAGAQVQLQALGTYIHPPVTKDITDQVAWSSNTPQLMTVNSSGVLTVTGSACGTALISATVTTNKSTGGISSSGALVTGYMTGNVVCFTGTGGGSGNPVLVVTFLGNGAGTVVSTTPTGFSCVSPGPCSTQLFTLGTTITLTATPSSGSTFGGWPTCPVATTTNACTFTIATSPTSVTVQFN
jgi:hypothetical protein